MGNQGSRRARAVAKGGAEDVAAAATPEAAAAAAAAVAQTGGVLVETLVRSGSQSGANDDTISALSSDTEQARGHSVDDFELLAVLGRGQWGKVMLVRKRDNYKLYAMKVIRKEYMILKQQVGNIKSERLLLQSVKSQFAVRLHYAFQTDDKLYLVLDYVNGGELFQHLRRMERFSEELTRFYAAEIVIALHDLHGMGILYRDLKPENVLVDADGHVKLCDFGLSKFLVSVPAGGAEAAGSSTPPTIPRTFTFCGTPEYLAPEVLTGEGYDFAVDYWCLGCLVFEMLTGLPPYYSQNIEEMYRWILEHQSPRFPPEMSAEARSLIEGLLNPDRDARLGCGGDEGFRRLQSHVFFKKINWKRAADRALKPPFVPEMSSPLDVSNFDSGFTSEPAVDSVVERQLDYTVVFESFSYASSAMNETIA